MLDCVMNFSIIYQITFSLFPSKYHPYSFFFYIYFGLIEKRLIVCFMDEVSLKGQWWELFNICISFAVVFARSPQVFIVVKNHLLDEISSIGEVYPLVEVSAEMCLKCLRKPILAGLHQLVSELKIHCWITRILTNYYLHSVSIILAIFVVLKSHLQSYSFR